MIKLFPVFTDHMVLQRNTNNKIFGLDQPAQSIELLFKDRVYHTCTDEIGYFEISLNLEECGGPYRMNVKGSSTLEITDIMIGDVYFLSGQSNMELQIKDTLDVTREEDYCSEDKELRYIRIDPAYSFLNDRETIGTEGWMCANKENILMFSAAGYYFGKEIRIHQHIPVGLINTAVGGSSLEAWMSAETLEQYGDYKKEIKGFLTDGELEKVIEEQENKKNNWLDSIIKQKEPDHTIWKECIMPDMFDQYFSSGYIGSIWLEKEFWMDDILKEEGILRLGLMIDQDYVYINDMYIGMSEHRYLMRSYAIPADAFQKGKNVIRIKLIIENGNGGMVKEKPYRLTVGNQQINLSGKWKYCEGIKKELTAPPVLFPPLLPMGLYYGVIKPLKLISFKAVLWYQGESNVGHNSDYCKMFHAMKSDWEKQFERELLFCCVQLAGYQDPLTKINGSGWGILREYQRRCSYYPARCLKDNPDAEKQCGLITAVDIGEPYDLHPHNKKEIGRRLSLWARHFIYGENIEYRGPTFFDTVYGNNQLILFFQHDDIEEKTIRGFEISYDGKTFQEIEVEHTPGKITICGNGKIKAVRYAGKNRPEHISFYNQSNIAAESFYIDVSDTV